MDGVWMCSMYMLLFGLSSIYVIKCDLIVQNTSWKKCQKHGLQLDCGIIPHDVPDGINSVRLINANAFGTTLRKGSFSSDNWRKIKRLDIYVDRQFSLNYDTVQNFDSFCFDGLQQLEILHIGVSDYITFFPDTLKGLRNLKLLDLSGCRRFDIDSLINALNNAELPNLISLNFSLLNSFRAGVKLADKFFKIVSDKRLKELDLSATQLLFLNITSFEENCRTLEYLNLSRLMLNNYVHDSKLRDCPNLKIIDASYIVLPLTILAARFSKESVISNKSIPFSLNWLPTKAFLNVEHFDLSGVTPKQTKYIFENVTLHIFGISRYSLKTLVLRDNNFERLDIRITSVKSKLESIDLSHCNIRFINPRLLSSFTILSRVDLSNNRLNEMLIEDVNMFEVLFYNLTELTNVNLAGNHLHEIPNDIFRNNLNIEEIDLSNNLLTQVSFDVERLRKVKFVNLEGNSIKILDDVSIRRLHSVLNNYHNLNYSIRTPFILLKNNPFICSSCESLPYLEWIVQSKLVNDRHNAIECQDEHGEKSNIDENAIKNVQSICDKTKIIKYSCISIGVAIVIAVVSSLFVRSHLRRQRYKKVMGDRIALIRHGAEEYQYLVFLSYSSKDEDFVNDYVNDSLNKHLQDRIGDDRDLVCEGDKNFQIGRPIHDQISILLKKSSVVLVLLSDNFCKSVFCRNEFDQALMLEKPIVLMIKDHVDTTLMSPVIRDLYEKKTRILWVWEDGEYVLKSTWDNVCTSLIELVACQKNF